MRNSFLEAFRLIFVLHFPAGAILFAGEKDYPEVTGREGWRAVSPLKGNVDKHNNEDEEAIKMNMSSS